MSENIHLNNKEYQSIVKLFNNEVTYALAYSKEEQCILLFVHGIKEGYIIIDNKFITLFDLAQSLSTIKDKICVKVVCCYGAYQVSYVSDKLIVKPYTNNKDVIYFKPFERNGEKYCNIHCSI